MTDASPRPGPRASRRRPARRPGAGAQAAGLAGAAVIWGALAAARLWAWLTRTLFYKD